MALILPIATKFNDAGVRKAKSSFGGLSKSLKGLAGAAGLALSLGAVVSVLKESAVAAANDARSQRLLALQMKTTTKATDKQIASTEEFISSLSMATGIMDDDLRPVMANAVRGTGSVAKAQKLLAIALDGAAASGKPVDVVMQALIRAQNGNTASLYKLAPQLKATKGDLDDYAASVKGAAETSANPFDRFAVAMDSLKEKVGTILLPLMNEFVTYLQNEVLPKVSQFLDDVQNPDTEVGAAWVSLKTTISELVDGFKTFFEQFSKNKNATEGLINVMNAILKALPALLAIKGIMVLAKAGKALKNLTDFFTQKFPTSLPTTPTPTTPGVPGAPTPIPTGSGNKNPKGTPPVPKTTPPVPKNTPPVPKGGFKLNWKQILGFLTGGGAMSMSGVGRAALSLGAIAVTPSSSMQTRGHEGEKQPARPKDKSGYTLYFDEKAWKWKYKKALVTPLVIPTPKATAAGGYYSGSTFIPSKSATTTPTTVNNGSVFNIDVKADNKTNGTKVGVDIINAIKDYERKNGNGWRK